MDKFRAAVVGRRDVLRAFGLAGAGLVVSALGVEAAGPAAIQPASLSGRQGCFYRFKIGAIEALALSDGAIFTPAKRSFWVGSTTDKVLSDLESARMSTETIELPFTVLLLKIGAELVLIDCGSGTQFGRNAGFLPESLAAAGVKPESITAIILTHAHGDHFGGLLDPVTKQAAFPNARLFMRRREYDYWTQEHPDVSQMVVPEAQARGLIPSARAFLLRFKDQWNFIEPGDRLLDGLEILDAAGHTPGQIGVLVSSGASQLMHFADVAHHHALSFANPDWMYPYDVLPKLAVETRRRFLERAAAERLRVFGSHLPFPGLGRVRKMGDHYEHVIEPWVSVPDPVI